MVACVILAAASLLWVLAQWIGRRSALWGKLSMIVSLLGFLGTAGGGAWFNLHRPAAETEPETVHRSGPADAGTSGPEPEPEAAPPKADAGSEADTDAEAEAKPDLGSEADTEAEPEAEPEPEPEPEPEAEAEPE